MWPCVNSSGLSRVNEPGNEARIDSLCEYLLDGELIHSPIQVMKAVHQNWWRTGFVNSCIPNTLLSVVNLHHVKYKFMPFLPL